MRTECLHRTLSPHAYAALQDQLRHEAEAQRRCAIQAFFGFALNARPATHTAQRLDRPGLDGGCPSASSQPLLP
jgi:hypothetical protein